MTRVYVGIGSNIEPRVHIPHALRLLRGRFGALTVSPVYACPAVGVDGPEFFNLVVGFDTGADPPMLTQSLRCMEAHCGRDRSARQGSRSMDLDLLLYGGLISPAARLPRSDVLRYAFTLKPLADIAPDQRHPVVGRCYADLWAHFDDDGQPLTVVELE